MGRECGLIIHAYDRVGTFEEVWSTLSEQCQRCMEADQNLCSPLNQVAG